jgi:hypothetical protein
MDSNSNLNPSETKEGQEDKVEKEHSALLFTDIEPKNNKIQLPYENITFTETATFVLFDMPASRIHEEDPMNEIIKQKNQKYLEVIK